MARERAPEPTLATGSRATSGGGASINAPAKCQNWPNLRLVGGAVYARPLEPVAPVLLIDERESPAAPLHLSLGPGARVAAANERS